MRNTEFIASELSRCNKCGYCMQSCPVYSVALAESHTARARNETIRSVVENDAPVTREMLQPFFDCLLCGACTVDCFGKVRTKDLVVSAREAYGEQYGRSRLLQYVFRKLLPDPPRMQSILRVALLGKRTGLSSLARELGLLRWLSPSLAAAEGLLRDAPRSFLWDRLEREEFAETEVGGVKVLRAEPQEAKGPDVLLFSSCAGSYLLPHVAVAAVRLLLKGGCRVTIAPNNCCGLPAWSYGDIEAARSLVRQNVEFLSTLSFDYLATECGSCSGFLKSYTELLPGDERASQLVERTRDITQVIAELRLPTVDSAAISVTYHDPCHLGRQQGIKEAPRQLLVDGGYTLIEMVESDRCCGGAGSYNVSHPDMSQSILSRKMAYIANTGADIVATACPACIMQLTSGLKRHGNRNRAYHVVELLARRLGIPFE